jgi:hypothetical protein
MTVPPEAVTAAAQFIDDEYYHATQRHIPDWSRDLAIGALEAAAPFIAAAQREADAQLAEEEAAHADLEVAADEAPTCEILRWFAALLRRQPERIP